MKRIGFVGLGNMGLPMAANLVKAGYEVVGFDIQQRARARGSEAGMKIAESAVAAARGADAFISMLPASEHVESLYLGADGEGAGLLDRMESETLLIDCSTIAPRSARRVATAAQECGIAMLDAPVSGGTAGAEKASLTFMVGGDARHLERAQSLFVAMGSNVFHAGPSGAGQVAKVCNNLLLAVQMVGTAESLALGVANGLDPATLSEIMRRSSGGNWALQVYNPFPGVMPDVPAARGYRGGFLVDLMIKDLGLAMDNAQTVGADTPMGSLAHDLYRALRSEYDAGDLDFSSIQRRYIEE